MSGFTDLINHLDAAERDFHRANDELRRVTRQRDELLLALKVYLNAGHKEARRIAAALAKDTIAKIEGAS